MKFKLGGLILGLSIVYPFAAIPQEQPILDLPAIVSSDTPLNKEIAHQCGGLVRYQLSNMESLAREKALSMELNSEELLATDPRLTQLNERMQRAQKMYRFFAERAETLAIMEGTNPETANYQRGLAMISFEQAYRATTIEALERTLTQPGNDDLVKQHMVACDRFYADQ